MLGGVSRGQLRRDIAARLGDYEEVTATDDGTDVILRSSVDLSVPTNAYSGRELIVTAGNPANVGLIRRVVQSSPAEGGRLSVTPPLPQPMLRGTKVELYDERSVGHRIAHIHRAINRAIRTAGDEACSQETAVVTGTSGPNGFTVPIPDDWVYLTRVQMTGASGWADVRIAQRENESGWWVTGAMTDDVAVVIRSGPSWSWTGGWTGGWAPGAPDLAGDGSGVEVRLEGLAMPAPLERDSDTTHLEYDWLVERCMSELQLANSRHRQDRGDDDRLGLIREQNAERIRSQGWLRRVLPSGSARRVR